MQRVAKWVVYASCALITLHPAMGLCDDTDALSLQVAPELPANGSTTAPLRLFLEASFGPVTQRNAEPKLSARRASIDLGYTILFSRGWRATLSDRLDYIEPVGVGSTPTLNSLREAYVGWQDEPGQLIVEAGRVNLRYGTAYGYNPTDFFRDGALRAVTSADPFAQRENRLGTVMLRSQQVWTGGALSLAAAPKLANQTSDASFSPDWGATNHNNRLSLSISGQPRKGVNAQAVVYAAQDIGMQVGGNLTALLSESTVAHLEWAGGRDQDVLAAALTGHTPTIARNRLAAGLTYTTTSHWSLTAEAEYNGFAASKEGWSAALSAGPAVLGNYLLEMQRRQDNASRRAYLLYASQRGGWVKSLDITAFLRINGDDRSRLGWVEMRYHLPSIDLALQWQQMSGGPTTEYGILPFSRSIQLLGTYYF